VIELEVVNEYLTVPNYSVLIVCTPRQTRNRSGGSRSRRYQGGDDASGGDAAVLKRIGDIRAKYPIAQS
jgi:hypothetical protein